MFEFDKTIYTDFAFGRNELLILAEAPTESLSIIIIYYMFKYTFGIKTNLLESLWSQKSPLKARLWQN